MNHHHSIRMGPDGFVYDDGNSIPEPVGSRTAAEMDRMSAEIRRLHDGMSQLPQTADGYPCFPGDKVWYPFYIEILGDGPHRCTVPPIWDWSSDQGDWEEGDATACLVDSCSGIGYPIGRCYHSREAAEQVRRAELPEFI